jgi:hypothetical protein
MPNEKAPEESDYLSPQEMRDWALQEVQDSAKAHELRAREAMDLANAYERGEITPQEAAERNWRYQHRWHEALPGATAQMTDEEIVKRIDETRGPYRSLKSIQGGYAKHFSTRRNEPDEPSR